MSNRRDAVGVFRRDEDMAVKACDLLTPAQRHRVLRRRNVQRHLFLKERHGIIAEIDDLEIGIIALLDIEQPAGRDIGELPGTGRAYDDADCFCIVAFLDLTN
jgi:hypothetical protein